MKKLAMILTVAGLVLAVSGTVEASTILGSQVYASRPGDNSLLSIDTSIPTAAKLPAGSSFNEVITGLAKDVATDAVYGVSPLYYDHGANPNTAGLFSIDTSTGQATAIGDMVNGGNVNGLAYGNGTLYASNWNSDTDQGTLLTVNTSDGEGTIVGSTGDLEFFVEGLGFDPAGEGILYGVVDLSNEIVTINTGTGVGSNAFNLPDKDPDGKSTQWRGLTFADGNLIASTRWTKHYLYILDPGTGIGSFTSSYVLPTDEEYSYPLVQGLTVPEPATMSLLALGGLGALIRRRNRK